MPVPPVILSIAGFDPSSGAGVTADIKTAAAHGCYAASCITALTVQSTQGVFLVQPLEPELVTSTLVTLAGDFEFAAVRLGMLGSGEVAAAVADFLEQTPLPNVVLDPVVRSSSGAGLLDEAGLDVLRKRLIPASDVITPNVHEAAFLLQTESLPDQSRWESALPKIREFASGLHDMGASTVIITGGHIDPPNDFLSCRAQGGDVTAVLLGERIKSRSTHGTGCAFAASLACRLALGEPGMEAANGAKAYVRRAIATAYPLGEGIGPINHLG